MGASRPRNGKSKTAKMGVWKTTRVAAWVESMRETGHLEPHENADTLTVSEFCARLELHETMLKDARDVIRALDPREKGGDVDAVRLARVSRTSAK